MEQMGVNIAILQETKVMDGLHTRFSSGYNVIATSAPSVRQGGVALVWKDGDAYEVEETRTWGPNVLAFQLVTGRHRYYVVGCYIPPSDLSALEDVRRAWSQCPSGARPLLVGDLNINLESPRDERDVEIAEHVDHMNLTDLTRHFLQCCQQ